MKLSKQFTTVTPLSKALALFFFILFPLLGFSLGIRYQQLSNQLVQQPALGENAVSLTPSAVPSTHNVCQSAADCSTDQRCVGAGPVMINHPMIKHCYAKDETIPL